MFETETSPTYWIDQQVGRRYVNCTFDNFDASGKDEAKKRAALSQCVEYVENFPKHYDAGRSLIFVGPKGTGKDHLMTATIKQICVNIKRPGKVTFADGLKLFAEFREAFGTATTESMIVDKYTRPLLFAVSDPLPPKGCLSEHEQRMALRIIDARYRESKPMAMTINAANRKEISDRMGAQACDRLFDCAIVVRCVWESHRTEHGFE